MQEKIIIRASTVKTRNKNNQYFMYLTNQATERSKTRLYVYFNVKFLRFKEKEKARRKSIIREILVNIF